MARPYSGDMAPVLIALGATVTVADRDGEADRPMADIFTDDGVRLEHGAVQCGYCTPGWLLSAKALLDENPNPTPKTSPSSSPAISAAAPVIRRSSRRSWR